MTVTTNDFHELAMDFAEEADSALRAGDRNAALDKFHKAAEYEIQAIAAIDKQTPRTLGIHVVSAVSLLLNAGELAQAMSFADRYRDLVPHGFAKELDEILGMNQTSYDLNQAVTDAILKAEQHDSEGVRLWRSVAKAEQAIADSSDSDITEIEKEIARRGEIQASLRANILEAIRKSSNLSAADWRGKKLVTREDSNG